MGLQYRGVQSFYNLFQGFPRRADPTLVRVLWSVARKQITVQAVDHVVPKVARVCLRAVAQHVEEHSCNSISVFALCVRKGAIQFTLGLVVSPFC